MMNRLFSLMMLALTAVALAGCNTAPVRDPAYAPIRPVVAAPKPEGNGAIYQAGYEQSWFEDMRARRVGDMLTIELAEKTDAKKKRHYRSQQIQQQQRDQSDSARFHATIQCAGLAAAGQQSG